MLQHVSVRVLALHTPDSNFPIDFLCEYLSDSDGLFFSILLSWRMSCKGRPDNMQQHLSRFRAICNWAAANGSKWGRKRRWPWPRFPLKRRVTHMVMVLWKSAAEEEKNDDHDQDSLKKTLVHIWSWSSDFSFSVRETLFSSDIPQCCLNPSLLNPHFRHSAFNAIDKTDWWSLHGCWGLERQLLFFFCCVGLSLSWYFGASGVMPNGRFWKGCWK